MARARGARSQLALAFETTYGTAPASGYTRMPYASSTLGAQQPLLENELLGYGRDPLPPSRDAITADGDVVIPIDSRALGYWLKGAFGAPATTGSDPYTHVFESGAWSLPSMAIEVGLPDVPSYAVFTGCAVDRINFQMQRSGLLTATVGLQAQGEDLFTTAQTGTLADLELTRFGHFNGSVKRNGSPLGNVVSAEVTYANNLDPVETIRADGKRDGFDPAMTALSGRIDVRFADTTLLDQAIAGDAAELEFGWSIASGPSLKFELPAVYLPRPRREIPGPQGIQVSFEWQAAQDDEGDPMCVVTLVNDVASY